MSEKEMQANAEGDENLSALLDGELSPEGERELRRRLTEEPALAERLAALAEVTGQVINLAGDQDPATDRSRLDRMHAALRVRLADADAEGAADRAGAPKARQQARVLRLRPALRWVAPAAAALAAGLVLYLGVGDVGSERSGATSTPPVAVEDLPQSSGTARDAGAEPSGLEAPVSSSEAAQLARNSLPAPATEAERVTAETDGEAAVIDLDQAEDVELAIAFEFNVLADIDVIENLDLLERMSELDTMERI